LMTVLGSCVAVCLADDSRGIFGMNHFMLPEQIHSSDFAKLSVNPSSGSARYGAYAMELLVNELLKAGASKDRLCAWVFGGAQILTGLSDIGESNVRFANTYLQREVIRVVDQDTGGKQARKLYLDPSNGEPECRALAGSVERIKHREQRYNETLSAQTHSMSADVSIFSQAIK
jgi:chemotaxis protein CheD